MQDNTELNVVVHGNGNHEQLQAWFKKLWDAAEPFAAELMRELKSSWALDESVTPYQDYLSAGGTPHRLTVSQRWSLDTIRDAYKATPDLFAAPADLKAAQDKLERLRKLWSVSPIDGRVEFALRGLRSQKPAREEAINRLESIAFEFKLDVLVERRVEISRLAIEPLIICTEALV